MALKFTTLTQALRCLMYDPIFDSFSFTLQCQSWRCRWGCPLRPNSVIVVSSLATTAFVKKTTKKRRLMAEAVVADPGYVTCRPLPVRRAPSVLTSTVLAIPLSRAFPVHPSLPLQFPTFSLPPASPTVPPPPASICCCRPCSEPAVR